MNATVGNIGEIIIAAFLILDGQIDVVHASITGSIIGNLLLVLGASLLVGGLKNGVQKYDQEVVGMNAASLILATIGLIVPATFALIVGGGPETDPGDPGVLPDREPDGRRRDPAADHLRRSDVLLPDLAGQPESGGRRRGRAVELAPSARRSCSPPPPP